LVERFIGRLGLKKVLGLTFSALMTRRATERSRDAVIEAILSMTYKAISSDCAQFLLRGTEDCKSVQAANGRRCNEKVRPIPIHAQK
jgi:hypothetical protein